MDVFNALIALKKDPDRLVLSADKGNCVVVMDKQQYHDKALSLLNDKSTYAVLNSDPSRKTQTLPPSASDFKFLSPKISSGQDIL